MRVNLIFVERNYRVYQPRAEVSNLGMGCECTKDTFSPDHGMAKFDRRDMLCVKILRAKSLPKGNMISDQEGELTAYVQLTYGNFDKVVIQPQADSGPNSLYNGKKGCETFLSKKKITENQNCTWNQTIYFPITSLNNKKSLEISIWDKFLSLHDQSKDEFVGKAILLHGKHPIVISKDAEYVLPSKWGEYSVYTLKLTSDDYGQVVTGLLDIEVRFRKKGADDAWKEDLYTGQASADAYNSDSEHEPESKSTSKYNEETPMIVNK